MPLHGRCYGVLFCLFAFTNSLGKAAKNGLDVPLAGYFGCKFNKDLCSPQEVCVDDDLFGNCQSERAGSYDLRSYDLDLGTLEQLEKFLRHLIDRKYSWRSMYTQCIVAGTLFAFRDDLNFNPKDCKAALDNNSGDQIDDEVLEYIQTFFDNVDDDSLSSLDRNREEPMDRNYATVHRYYEPTKKEDSLYPPLDSQALSSKDDKSQDYIRFLKSLTPGELKILEKYAFRENRNELNSEVQRSEDNQPQMNNQKTTNDDEQEPPIKKSDQVLTSVEGQVLLKLLNGDLDVNALTDDEVKRMSNYVSRLLGDNDQKTTQQSVQSEAATVLPSVGADQKYSEQMMDGWANRDPVGVMEVSKSKDSGAEAVLNWATPSVTEITKEQSNDVLLSKYAAQKKEVPSIGEKSATVVVEPSTKKPKPKYALVENDYTYITFSDRLESSKAMAVVQGLEALLGLSQGTFDSPRLENNSVIFHVSPDNKKSLNASQVAALAYQYHGDLEQLAGLSFVEAGIGNVHKLLVEPEDSSPPRYFILTFVLCGCVAGVLIIVVALYLVRRHSRTKQKLAQLAGTADPKEASQDYQDLCRQRMQTKAQEKPEPLHIASRIGSSSEVAQSPRSSKSSTSSWSEEPVTTNMDISTGHVVLSYMEDHLKDRDRLEREWDALCAYEAEPSSTEVASKTNNARKNRYTDVLPYDHSRVTLNPATNVSSSDYVNASSITDHDPRNPAYIATQAPLPHTVADFWQMVWEQGSVVIVMLTSLTENGMAMCHRYWPEEGSDLYHIYEVHLVSEHIWCDDFLVRSFYLKNLQTNETRTVTQFHYLTWPEGGIPSSAKSLLDFRRKVNKSYRGRSCPVIVHCNDGVGRTGTYILIDMVLNRMYKGAKEIDIAATLEHIRDQRTSMLQTKDQFEFSLAAVAEEVHAVLKALPQ